MEINQLPLDIHTTELTKLFHFVSDGSSCQVISLPGAGRASLLEYVAVSNALQKKYLEETYEMYHFVNVDFSEVRNRPLFDVMKLLFLNLTESLREQHRVSEHEVVGNMFREHLQFQDELVLFQGFKEAIEYLATKRSRSVVFICNRFNEYIPSVTSAFFTNLRVLRSKAKYHFSVVFSVDRPLEQSLEPLLLADYYEFIADKHIYLHLYDASTSQYWLDIIQKITGKHISKTFFTDIIQVTGGHAKLTKLAVEAVLAHNQTADNLQNFLLEQKTIQGALQEIWQMLSPAEQQIVSQKEDTAKETEYLKQIGLINDAAIQIPLFEIYVSVQKQEKTGHILYDASTNTIVKGTTILSDQLTSSEFRLLRYLMQHQEVVVEREDLIAVVWQENKSTAGITDQAVDQLIFRIRHKIEDNPTQPTHLITVKGRGFKFVG